MVVNRAERIIELVALTAGTTPKVLKGKARDAKLVAARYDAMYLIRHISGPRAGGYFAYSLPRIGKLFSDRHHTTVMHALKKVRKKLESEEGYLILKPDADAEEGTLEKELYDLIGREL